MTRLMKTNFIESSGFNHQENTASSKEVASLGAWYTPKREEIPAALTQAGITLLDLSSEAQADYTICFCPIDSNALGKELVSIREQLGPKAYLIAVPNEAISDQWVARTIELGADDVLLMGQASNLHACLARANRVIAASRSKLSNDIQYQEERDYLQRCIDSLPTPMFFKNRQGIYIGCNKAFEGYVGLEQSKIIGHSVYEVAPSNLAKIYESADEALMQAGEEQFYEANVRYANGKEHVVSFHKAAMKDSTGNVVGLAGVMLDITTQKKLEAKLTQAAERDPLTNCYNRRKFFELAEPMLEQGQNEYCAIFIADIDLFKSINDAHGHATGDMVLQEIAWRLENTASPNTVVARAGGEEFYFIGQYANIEMAKAEARALNACISSSPIQTDQHSIQVTISLGVASVRLGNDTLAASLNRADIALYEAKKTGRDKIICAG